MQIAHLNYCRQLMKQFQVMAAVPDVNENVRATVLNIIERCRDSQKFLLPEGGHLIVDLELRALSDLPALRLPYQFVALEFFERWARPDGVKVLARRILFVREMPDGLYVRPSTFLDANNFWSVQQEFFIPGTGCIDRADPKNVIINALFSRDENERSQLRDTMKVLMFLNALACSNVHIERSERKNVGKKINAALPFDTYHVLTVDVGRMGRPSDGAVGGSECVGSRSLREHLRRGHIVRPGEGRRPFWRNATIVNAGRGFAKVKKDYRLRNAPRVHSPMPGPVVNQNSVTP